MRAPAVETHVAYWLAPAFPAREFLVELIVDLAARYDAPPFEPHVTLYSSREKPEVAREILSRTAAGFSPISLVVRGVEYSKKFTKTLFVQFEPDLRLSQLSQTLREASSHPRDYELNPHLSLLYAKIPDREKATLARSLQLAFKQLRFDAVKVISAPRQTKNDQDVRAWRILTSGL
ncbi:MAG: 2'-5' RNA ligase family protein [Chthoniobacterales bacterium]